MPDTLWDCHVHVIGDRERFPLSPTRGYEPPDAPVGDLLAHLDRLGIARAVIVQPSVYGYDNACLLDAIARSEGRCVGVAVPDPATTFDGLEALHEGGVRGLRCNLINPGGLPLAATGAWWPWMRDHGWTLQLQLDATAPGLAALLERPGLPRVVIDHMGYPPKGTTPDRISALTGALGGEVWVKISAPYRITAMPPPYPDATALAEALIGAAPSHCLFATDWPHTELAAPPMPDAEWLARVQGIAGDGWKQMQAAADSLYGS